MTAIVGIVRFSVLSTKPSPFKAYKNRSFEEIASMILDERRLARRFQLFETICLPSLDAQTDKDFILFLVAPKLMPEHWKERLIQLVSSRNYLRVTFADQTDFAMTNCSDEIFDLITGDVFYTFRLDDDDALTCDYVARIRASLAPHFVGYAISHCKGHYLDMSNEGYRIRHEIVPNIATGFGFVSSLRAPRTIFDVSEHHHRFHKWCPVLTDARRATFLATTHDANDTGDQRRLDAKILAASEAANRLRRSGFAVELELYERLGAEGFSSETPIEHDLLSVRPDVSSELEIGLLTLSSPTQHDLDEQQASSRARNEEIGKPITRSRLSRALAALLSDE